MIRVLRDTLTSVDRSWKGSGGTGIGLVLEWGITTFIIAIFLKKEMIQFLP